MGVKAMAVTDTARGITGKQLLIATSTDQVYALDKRFLDPRRPLGNPTPVSARPKTLHDINPKVKTAWLFWRFRAKTG